MAQMSQKLNYYNDYIQNSLRRACSLLRASVPGLVLVVGLFRIALKQTWRSFHCRTDEWFNAYWAPLAMRSYSQD